MYNSEQKDNFLEYLNYIESEEDIIKRFTIIFDNTQSIEEETGKDLCYMDLDELITVLNHLCDKKSSIRTRRTQLSQYLDWCRANQIIRINQLDSKLTPASLIYSKMEYLTEKYYISPDKYEEQKNKILSTENAIYFAAIYMAIYEGIAGDRYVNMVHLRRRDINIKDCTVSLYNGLTRKISKELANLLYKCSYVTQLFPAVSNKPKQLKGSLYEDSVWKDVRESNTVLERKFSHYLIERIRKIVEEEAISKDTLESSGLFNYIVSRAKEDDLDIKEDMMAQNVRGTYNTSIENVYGKYFLEYGSYTTFALFKLLYQDWIIYI